MMCVAYRTYDNARDCGTNWHYTRHGRPVTATPAGSALWRRCADRVLFNSSQCHSTAILGGVHQRSAKARLRAEVTAPNPSRMIGIDQNRAGPDRTVAATRWTAPSTDDRKITAARSVIERIGARPELGFTLIELMVVLLIIAILLAIAIPTFLGARNTANARSAQSNLRNALTSEQTNWTNNQAFATGLSALEPSLTWVTGATVSGSNSVLAKTSDSNQIVVITELGKDNNCWSIAQVNDPADSAFEGASYTKTAPASGACSSPTPPAAAATAGSAGSGTAGTWYSGF
jgi:type IV pilus assembly protein PilA